MKILNETFVTFLEPDYKMRMKKTAISEECSRENKSSLYKHDGS